MTELLLLPRVMMLPCLFLHHVLLLQQRLLLLRKLLLAFAFLPFLQILFLLIELWPKFSLSFHLLQRILLFLNLPSSFLPFVNLILQRFLMFCLNTFLLVLLHQCALLIDEFLILELLLPC